MRLTPSSNQDARVFFNGLIISGICRKNSRVVQRDASSDRCRFSEIKEGEKILDYKEPLNLVDPLQNGLCHFFDRLEILKSNRTLLDWSRYQGNSVPEIQDSKWLSTLIRVNILSDFNSDPNWAEE